MIEAKRRILVIGLDGACMDLIKAWADDGKLSTFEQLMKEGSYGYLESVTPPLTIPAWNCLASGKNPGKIGHYSFLQKAPGSYDFRVYLSLVKKERDIWDILSDYGRKVFVFNAPNILYAYKINGYMVAGFLCPSEKNLAYPKSLMEVLYSSGYVEGEKDAVRFLTASDSERSKMLKEQTEKQCKILFHLLSKDWDFGFVVFQELDGIQHRLWHRKDIVLRHYQHIDKKLKQILEKLEGEENETEIIIVSDHGFGPNNRMFLINEWLSREGFLKIRRGISFEVINMLIRTVKGSNALKIFRMITKIPCLTPLCQRLFLQSVKIPVIWDKTRAFSYGNWGMIYINLEEREPEGTVKKEEYERLRDEIIEKLGKISVRAYKKEEIYHGKYLDLAPDIVIEIDNYVNSVNGKVGYNKIFMPGFPQTGYHSKNNGTFIAWGSNIKRTFEANARIYDIAPTILYMFGLPIPRDVDGRILKEIFKDNAKIQKDEKRRIKEKINALKRKGKV
ncbi:hypothetical protein DRN46_06360 [Thermococci archaeon]|nr:MAG: hypothetical protein DRN46_06360 [Thermococci archaeon]